MQDITKPGQILGYLKNGLPFHLIGGGATDDDPFSTDPPEGGPAVPPQEQPQFTAADIARAREEEKNKVYKTIEKAKADAKAKETELAELRRWRQEQEAALQAQRKAEEDALRKQAEEEMSAKQLIEAKDREWQAKLDAIE